MFLLSASEFLTISCIFQTQKPEAKSSQASANPLKPLKQVEKQNASKKANKEAKVKDPYAPKRNLTAFMFYSQARRPEIKEENPDMAITDIAKVLGEEWKELDDAGKKVRRL